MPCRLYLGELPPPLNNAIFDLFGFKVIKIKYSRIKKDEKIGQLLISCIN